MLRPRLRKRPIACGWCSSRTIRAASFRDAVLKGKMTQADAEKSVAQPMDEYEILVRATNMYIFQQRGEKSNT